MALPKETLQEIDALVRGGFEDRDRIVEIFCEEKYAPGELDPAAVAAAVDSAFAALETEIAGWPSVTDCDKLDRAFAALNHRGSSLCRTRVIPRATATRKSGTNASNPAART